MSTARRDVRPDLGARDAAIDRLYELPLSHVPLQTPGLRKASLVKSAQLRSMVELFRSRKTGRGLIAVAEIRDFFQQDPAGLDADIAMLEALAGLESFDVFSLRIELRRLGIDYVGTEGLQLSQAKQAELSSFMRRFTRPLIERIYGAGTEAADAVTLIDLFRRPKHEDAKRALMSLAETLDIDLLEVPAFLEDCGDTFLSISYFKSCLDQITSVIPEFIDWTAILSDNYQVRSDPNNQRVLAELSRDLTDITTSLVGRFDKMDQRSIDLWDGIDSSRFRAFRDFVRDQHVSLGAVLCGLSVKMKLWHERFPNRGGGPVKRIDFIKSEIVPGLGRIREIEARQREGQREG